MNPSQLREVLAQIEHHPIKRLGQNFLHDQNLADFVAKLAVGADPSMPMVEIGPGLGALTAALIRQKACLVAVERDPKLAAWLSQRYSEVQVHHADALDFDWRILAPAGPHVLVGNLPYNISSPLLEVWLQDCPLIVRSVLMVQWEFAQRILAEADEAERSALGVMMQFQWNIVLERKVGPNVFYPKPDVASAVIRLERKPASPESLCDRPTLLTLVQAGFQQRRKQLRSSLKEFTLDWSRAPISPELRAENVTTAQWVSLAQLLRPPGLAQREAEEVFDVLDENDQVLYQATRKEVHARQLRHRAIHILLQNERGELLLQKRSFLKDKHPGTWDSSAAGHVDAGEDYEQSAQREVLEECGVRVSLQRIGLLPPQADTGFEFIGLYFGRHEGPFTFPVSEIEALHFFPIPVVEQWLQQRPQDFAPGFCQCWPHFLRWLAES